MALKKSKNTLKAQLAANEITLGSWITLAHPAIAEIAAKAGFDWLVVDLEHSVITIQEAENLIRIISMVGVSPLVRLTSNDPNQIKRVMDAGRTISWGQMNGLMNWGLTVYRSWQRVDPTAEDFGFGAAGVRCPT